MPKPLILIVDDDRAARETLGRILEREGFEQMSCGDGREALQLIDSARPTLIVSDYEMPEFTGAQLCEIIRQQENHEVANLPVILLTAHSGEDHEVESLESGANDFVTKPVNVAVLKARIATQLRLASLRRQLELQNMELEEWRRSRELDLEAAQLTQRAILPVRPPRIAGWETAAHYQPVIQVGGDMYDWLRMPDGQWLFWMTDATGHGASAALLTALTKLVFRHAASETSHAGEIMQAVNGEFHSTLRGKSFMTAACVVIRPEAGRLTFAGAGHPPLLIRRGNGTLESLRSQSPPLGILSQQHFGETGLEIAPGELALLYTDGLYSAPDGDGAHLNPEDLESVLPKEAVTAPEFVQRTVERIGQRLQNAPLPDDLAMIALRRLP